MTICTEGTAMFGVPVLLVFEADHEGQLGAENAIEEDAEEKGESEVEQVHEVEELVDGVLVLQRGYVAHGVGKGERQKGQIEADRDEGKAHVASH